MLLVLKRCADLSDLPHKRRFIHGLKIGRINGDLRSVGGKGIHAPCRDARDECLKGDLRRFAVPAVLGIAVVYNVSAVAFGALVPRKKRR